MGNSIKTRILNLFRRIFINNIGEKILYILVRNKNPEYFFSKFVPMPYLYSKSSWKKVIRSGLKLNLDISDFVDWYIFYGFKDPGYEFLFSHINENDIILDIGANIGYVSLRLSRLTPKGFVYGFEPSAYNFRKFQTNLGLNDISNLRIFNHGMAGNEGLLKLMEVDRNNRGMNKISESLNFDENVLEEIKVTKVDQWVLTNNINRVNVIKIDVEGYEMEILKGSEFTLKNLKPWLFIEVDDNFLKGYGSSASELFNWLISRGYQIFNLSGNLLSGPESLLNQHTDIYAK